MKHYAIIVASLLLVTGCRDAGQGGFGGTETGTADQTGVGTGTTATDGTTGVGTTPRDTGTSPGGTGTTAPGAGGYTPPPGQQPPGQVGGDQALEQRIRETLRATIPPQAAASIQVTASNGRVTIRGNVPGEAERERVEDLIQQMPGVREVENQLQVQPQGAPGGQPPGGAQPPDLGAPPPTTPTTP
jgi:hypothetical protein